MPTRERTALPTDPARLEPDAAPARPPAMMLNDEVYRVAAEASHLGLRIAGLPEVPAGSWHRFVPTDAVTAMAPGLAAQGDDLARGLLLFADGRRVDGGPENAAAGWIAAHLGACFGHDRVDETEALDWVVDREWLWLRIASDPLAQSDWVKAPRPWSALAAIFEWVSFLRHRGDEGDFVSRLPVTLRNLGAADAEQHAKRCAPLTAPALYCITAAAQARDIAILPFGPDLYATRAADAWRLLLTAAEVLRPLASYGAKLARSHPLVSDFPPAVPTLM